MSIIIEPLGITLWATASALHDASMFSVEGDPGDEDEDDAVDKDAMLGVLGADNGTLGPAEEPTLCVLLRCI
eukprot:CAMPEP_0184669172 /NCGR_PEP_ID=MMETSP0308-20130426/76164_1 /TAXON_ID=38269 /ORGANISM="Gloeochaete witrockiana, Strain SAG 46.84" /LENGTH=71 /DNA_ID=CAMNT_0027115301 /DNA_START=72 /DNA_END=287 /DNA_ORIENTATION=-